MNKYELVVVLGASLSDEDRAAAVEKVNGYVARFGGNVTDVAEWGKKKLAYPVAKETEAFYYVLTFEAPLSAPREIENNVRIMEQVIRFLIVKQEA